MYKQSIGLEIEDMADLVLEYLHQLGVEYIFGVPGGAIEPLYNALARSEKRGGIRAIIARHECGAAFMADGYYRETGKLGVVCSTTGPGATNLVTGVANAYVDKIPMLVLTAQTALPKFGKRSLQDSSETAVNTVGIFKHVTRFNCFVSHQAQLESKLNSALMAAFQSPKGPVHISIPSDILQADHNLPESKVHINNLMRSVSLEDKSAVMALCEEVINADRVVMFLGGNCGRASKQIGEFAHMINAPYVTGSMGKRWIDERDSLYQGVYGFAGHQSARDLLRNQDIDLILAVGTSFSEMSVGIWEDDILNEKLIHIDSTVENFSRSPMAKLHVCGHLDAIFSRLIRRVREAKTWRKTWQSVHLNQEKNSLGSYVTVIDEEKCHSNDVPIKPQRLISFLNKILPMETRVYVDAGNAWSWCIHYMVNRSTAGNFRISMGYGSMAWAIGAAIGGAFAQQQELANNSDLESVPHVCITGDGAYLMSGQEITVAAQHQLPVIIIVLNDAALGMVRHGQKLSGAESIGWKLNNINYAKIAESMGIRGIEVRDPRHFDTLDLLSMSDLNGPVLVDVRIDPDEVPPMGLRVKTLVGEVNSNEKQ